MRHDIEQIAAVDNLETVEMFKRHAPVIGAQECHRLLNVRTSVAVPKMSGCQVLSSIRIRSFQSTAVYRFASECLMRKNLTKAVGGGGMHLHWQK